MEKLITQELVEDVALYPLRRIDMKILVACEESQRVCIAFRRRGHEAYSCDILEPSGGHPEWHIMNDVLPILNGDITFETMDGEEHFVDRWDMIIAFPPCTHLAVSGAPSFAKKREDGRQREGLEFFCKFFEADCDKIVIENPVNIVAGDYCPKWFPDIAEKYNLPRKPSQYIQPYEYGEPTRKKTGLWIKGLPNLKPTNIVDPELVTYTTKDGRTRTDTIWHQHTGKGDSRERSKTYIGIANAMAEQWGLTNLTNS